MTTCKEHDFSLVASIIAYPVGTLIFKEPLFVTVPSCSLSSLPDDKLVINFNRETVKCTDKNSANPYGYVHEVSLDWDFVPSIEAEYTDLVTLQHVPHDFIIRYFGGEQKIIRTDATAYQFLFNDDNGVMKCSATLVNGSGLLPLILSD